MAATVNQLIAAAKKQATIAAKIERRARWLAPYDADRLAGGIAAFGVGKIAGGVVIDPMAAYRPVLAAARRVVTEANGFMNRVLQAQTAQIILPAVNLMADTAQTMMRDAAMNAVGGVLGVIKVNAGVVMADSGMNLMGRVLDTINADMRLTLAPDLRRLFTDWQDRSLAPVIAGMAEVQAALLEYQREGTFTGDVLRVVYEGERYTEIEAEQALNRLIDSAFTLGAVTGNAPDLAWPDELKPYVKPLIRQAIQESATRDLDLGKLRTWLLRRVCRLWAGKSCEMLMILHDFGVQRPGQVLTLPPVASAPALESGGGLAPKRNGKGGRPRLRVLDEHQVGHARSYLSRIKRGQDKESSAQCEGHDVDTLEKWVKLLPQNPENTE